MEKVRRNEPKDIENFFFERSVKNGESRNSCIVKIGGVTSGSWWRWKQLEHLCQTGGCDSMYSLTGVTARFGGTTACRRPLRPHSDFWGGGQPNSRPLLLPSPGWVIGGLVVRRHNNQKTRNPWKFCVSNFAPDYYTPRSSHHKRRGNALQSAVPVL